MKNEIISLENIPAESTVNVSANTNLQVETTTLERMTDAADDLRRMILERMDRIIEQGDGLAAILREIQAIPINDSPYGGNEGASRAKAIGDIYVKREDTNQKMLDILKQMYDDAKSERAEASQTLADRLAKFDWVGVSAATAELILKAVKSE